MRRILCALAVSLLAAWPASLSAQLSPSPSIASPPVASAAPLSSPAPTWDQLDEIWAQLEQSGQTSSVDLAILRTSLASARQLSTTLSAQLDASRTQALELSSSLERVDSSLQACERSLAEAICLASRRSLEAGLWRAFGCAAGAGLVEALVAGKVGQGTAYAAAGGVVAGGAWWLAENWPPWLK
jgi:hypothetical protein